jgi:serine/threonine protein kinase
VITPLSGYDLEQLQAGDEFDLLRGRHRAGAHSVLARVVKTAPPAPKPLGRLERELALANDLDEEWALHPLGFVHHDGRAALMLTDPGGLPLDAVLGGRPSELMPALQIAVSLASAIRRVHARGLIHRDIKPSNVWVNPAGVVHLTGFGIASRLLRERQVPIAPEAISGTFAYMAPEQTGRMNRSVDARTDL